MTSFLIDVNGWNVGMIIICLQAVFDNLLKVLCRWDKNYFCW